MSHNDYIEIDLDIETPDGIQPLHAAHVLPAATVQQVIESVQDEFAVELHALRQKAGYEAVSFALWWPGGTGPLPLLTTMQHLGVEPQNRLVLRAADVPHEPSVSVSADSLRRIEGEPPHALESGVLLLEQTSRNPLNYWTHTPMVIGRRGSERLLPRIDLDKFPDSGVVSVDHVLISKRRESHYYVIDLGSTNGTTLNGQPLTPLTRAYPLQHNDVIRLGTAEQYIGLVFRRT
ncbi:MAG: FHA domain-containing protein [bacterium]|nr:FHA domain-containing protein [bacterium]